MQIETAWILIYHIKIMSSPYFIWFFLIKHFKLFLPEFHTLVFWPCIIFKAALIRAASKEWTHVQFRWVFFKIQVLVQCATEKQKHTSTRTNKIQCLSHISKYPLLSPIGRHSSLPFSCVTSHFHPLPNPLSTFMLPCGTLLSSSRLLSPAGTLLFSQGNTAGNNWSLILCAASEDLASL